MGVSAGRRAGPPRHVARAMESPQPRRMADRPLTPAHRAASMAHYRKKIADLEARLGEPGGMAHLEEIDRCKGFLARLEAPQQARDAKKG